MTLRSNRFKNELPRVDIFVCTADPVIEPPMMVISTVLSVMAYDYPMEKLSVYLSDDGSSELTFFALTQAAVFSKHWLPYCRNYKAEPRSPTTYFKSTTPPSNTKHHQDFYVVKVIAVLGSINCFRKVLKCVLFRIVEIV